MTRPALCLSILMPLSCFAGLFSPAADSLILQGIEQSFMASFDSALTLFQEVSRTFPDHPAGPFYMASTYQSMMMHYETDRWESTFFTYIDSTEKRVETWLISHPGDPWNYFFRGSMRSYRGLYEAKRGRLVDGFVHAKKGVDDLKTALLLDSTLYDAHVSIGNYKYWSGKFYKYLRWLPFIKDERIRGEQEVVRGIALGCFSYWIGCNSLAWIKYDRGKYDEAIALFEQGAAHFNNSLIWFWGLADTHKKAENWDTALDIYRIIIARVHGDTLESGYNEVLARWKIIQCLEALNRPELIETEYEAMLRVSVENSRYEKAMECRSKAEKAAEKARKGLKKKPEK